MKVSGLEEAQKRLAEQLATYTWGAVKKNFDNYRKFVSLMFALCIPLSYGLNAL